MARAGILYRKPEEPEREQGWVGWVRDEEVPQTPWLSRRGRAERRR